ncbi:MAG: formate dehydrogenase accessory sulfurtransferase FdhD [Thermodesulfobacteriota bacterium]
MDEPEPTLKRIDCWQYRQGAWRSFQDTIAPETALTLHWPEHDPVSLLAFPQELPRLCLGHAWLEFCKNGEIPGIVAHEAEEYRLAVTQLRDAPCPAPLAPQLDPEHILAIREQFMCQPGKWEHTGCFHRAAVYDPRERRFLQTTEDIGRHNCLDRLAGWALEMDCDLRATVLVVTARATTSLVNKAIRAGFPLLISQSAVTTRAVATARQCDLTLVGFVREQRLTVFTDSAQRIRTSA